MTRLLASGGPDAVAVVLVGDELLLGRVSDSNASWLARLLIEHGLRLVEVTVVPDEVGRIAAAVRRATESGGSVVVSGGIGPTSDDVTREGLALAADSPLVSDWRAEQTITASAAARGREPTQQMLRMAERPADATMLVNEFGTAPGVRVELEDAVVYAVPGVPSEFQEMLRRSVLPEMLRRSGRRVPVRSVSIEVAGLGEPRVAALLQDVDDRIANDPAVDLAYLAQPAHISVRVSVREPDAAVADRRLSSWAAQIEDALAPHVMGRDGTTLPEAVVAALVEQSSTVAVAESLTGGGVLRELTTVPGSSAVVRGGVVAYASDLKASVLDVPGSLLSSHGPVHPVVAEAMARGVRARLDATYGLGTTGVAGPDPVGRHQPGEVYVAVAGPAGARSWRLSVPGDRDRVRRVSVAQVLDRLRRILTEREHGGPAVR